MLEWWLTRLETVRRATTQAEREAIYRFRYRVYIDELKRDYPGTDHERRWLRGEEDEKPYSTLLYTGVGDDVTSTLRLRVWPPGQVPARDWEELSLDLFPEIGSLGIAEMGRVMIRPTMRGKLLLPSLLRAAYEFLAGETETHLTFVRCVPGLVRHYRQLGGRPYGGRLIKGASSTTIPLVTVLSDQAHLKSVGSVVAPLVKRYFGRGKRQPLDVEPFRHLLEGGAVPVEFDQTKVWEEVQDQLLRAEEGTASFLDSLPPRSVRKLTSSGFLLQIKAGDALTQEGTEEREMYVILDGGFEVVARDRQVAVLGRGDLVGEVAFFLQEGARTASVRALTDGRVLVLRRKFLKELLHSDPEAAWQILMNTSRILAERLAQMVRGDDAPGTRS